MDGISVSVGREWPVLLTGAAHALQERRPEFEPARVGITQASALQLLLDWQEVARGEADGEGEEIDEEVPAGSAEDRARSSLVSPSDVLTSRGVGFRASSTGIRTFEATSGDVASNHRWTAANAVFLA